MLYKIVTLLILLSPISFKLFKIPLVIFAVFIIFITVVSNKVFLNKNILNIFFLILLFNSLVLLITLFNINSYDILTGIHYEPIVPSYYKITQIIGGIIYINAIYLFLILFYFFIDSKYKLKITINTIYIFTFINIIITLLELFNPYIHLLLMEISGYSTVSYFFVLRPVGIFLNSYINAFFISFFSFWSFHLWIQKSKFLYFILFILGVISVILCGARFAIILLLMSITIYSFLKKKFIFFIIIILMFFILIGIIYFINPKYLELVLSVISLSDESGSANVHKELFFYTLKLFIDNILGIGIGRADFGALNTLKNLAYDSESFILTLLLESGIIGFIIYFLIHFLMIKNLVYKKYYHIASFLISILLISFINIQILQSITSAFLIAILYLPSLKKILKV